MVRIVALLAGLALVGACAAPAPIVHALRTDLDGAEAEHIYVFRPHAARAEVYKMRSPCTNAALVRAAFAGAEARAVSGGALTREGGQATAAVLTVDAKRRSVTAKIGGVGETETLLSGPLWLYDFDFSEFPQFRLQDGPETFRASVLMGDPEGSPGAFVRDEGEAILTLVERGDHEGKPALRYRVEGPAFETAGGGHLWVDAGDGRVLGAEIGKPNHPGYRGLAFREVALLPGGRRAWARLLAAHFEGCLG